ncbi:MAG TPA: alpha/beta hydrolase [Pseudonocardia sp.]|nr:alpha/beta hydrolase [Pseudonocardia sp.]
MTLPSRRGASAAVVAAVAALALLAAGCSGEPPAGPQGSIAWESCGSGFECATLPVPLDHADPEGERIDLALIRLPATSPGSRQGSLVVNPGGPGGSGVDFVRGGTGYFGRELRERFDIVGFDPRGGGRSTAIDCGDETLTGSEDVAFPPRNDADREALTAQARRAVDACLDRSGELARHLSTEAAARDMDLLRRALGEERITYHGVSYGTFLGATYAALFPDRVRAMVLDAPLDPASWQDGGYDLARDTTAGFDQALRAFFEECRRNPGSCPFGDGDPAAAFDRLMRSLEEAPLSGGGYPVDRELAVQVTGAALYDDSAWPTLADALARAERGDGGALRRLAGPVGEDADLSGDAFVAIRCSDRAAPPDPGAVEALARELEAINPHFGPHHAYADVVCASWPEPASRYTGPYAAEGAPPILVVGTTGDPATPIGHARALAAEMSSAVLVVRDGEGHGAYAAGSDCVDGAVDAYLLRLTLPEDGLVCGDGTDG